MTDRTMWLRLALSSALAVASALAFGALTGAQAQNYPSKPVRLVLPYAPGGIIDYVGRTLAQKLTENLGQPVVAENRPGGGGVLGTDSVARSAPDGYTLVLMDPAIIINPTLQPEVLVISPILPVKTFPELVAYGRANPGKLNFASAGIGTTPHLAGEMFKLRTGIDATHIPYKGIGASYTDMMSGKVQMAFSSIAGALPFTTDNRVRAIATTGAKRSSVYPDLPTVAEAGLAGFEVDLWLGVFAPAKLPVPILARLNGELTKALEAADLKAALAKVGVEPRGTSPEEGATFLRTEFDKWRQVITDGKIKEN